MVHCNTMHPGTASQLSHLFPPSISQFRVDQLLQIERKRVVTYARELSRMMDHLLSQEYFMNHRIPNGSCGAQPVIFA